MMSIINWLENWYESNCNGDWEHTFGITIDTLDNPGWCLKINITETLYENVTFEDVTVERAENDWIFCRKKDGSIDCSGGPKNLEEMLGIVKKWMDDNKPNS